MFQTQSYPSPSNPSITSPPTTFVTPHETSHDTFSDSTPSVIDPNDTSEHSSSKKKRKSWGQVLPLPTTNLPPRKRAKTDAEKEQRRYERVQRNRAAAHASRMRKQEETDNLRAENNRLKQDVHELRQIIQRMSEGKPTSEPLDFAKLLTPPRDYASSSLDSVPSLSSGSPHSSPTSTSINTPPPSGDSEVALFANPSDAAHSAVMCSSQQWTSDTRTSPPRTKGRRAKARTKRR